MICVLRDRKAELVHLQVERHSRFSHFQTIQQNHSRIALGLTTRPERNCSSISRCHSARFPAARRPAALETQSPLQNTHIRCGALRARSPPQLGWT